MLRWIAKTLRAMYAPYLVIDSYGTAQSCWTLADAIDWLDYAAPDAYVVNAYTGAFMVRSTCAN